MSGEILTPLFAGEPEPGGWMDSDAAQRCVYVETKRRFTSGFIYCTGVVITVRHFLKNKPPSVDGKPAEVIYQSKRLDLAALLVKTKSFPPLRIEEHVALGQRVYYYGNTTEAKVQRFNGEINHIGDEKICATALSERGTCGSALWGDDLIGILNPPRRINFTTAIPGKIVKRFIQKALAKLERHQLANKGQVDLPFKMIQEQLL